MTYPVLPCAMPVHFTENWAFTVGSLHQGQPWKLSETGDGERCSVQT